MNCRWMFLAVCAVSVAHSLGAQLRRSESARQVTRLDSARQQGCVTEELGGGPKCPRDFRLVVDTRVTGYRSDDTTFTNDVRHAVRFAVMNAGFYPLTLRDATAADSAVYVIVEVKRTMRFDVTAIEALEVGTSLGGSAAPARACYKAGAASVWGEPASMHITFGALLRDVVDNLARCAQRARSGSG